MKRITYLFCLFFWTSKVLAQGTLQFAVPNAQANVEGNSSASDLMTASSFRLQMVFDASQFAALGGGVGSINQIYFRIDGASTFDVLSVFGGSAIQLSTTTRSPDSLSPVFADNIGADVRTIYSGGASFGGGYFPGSSPQPFGNGIPVSNPFFYNPAQGNLLLDIRCVSGQVLFPGALDAQNVNGDPISRVFAANNLASSGIADSLGLITRFDVTVIPEPSVCILFGIGLTSLFFFRRR